VPPDPCLYLRGLLLWRETGDGEETVKGKEGERWREGFGPPKNFGVAPPVVATAWETLEIRTAFIISDKHSVAGL